MKLPLRKGSNSIDGPSVYGGFEPLKILNRRLMVVSLDPLLLQHELQSLLVLIVWSLVGPSFPF